jgi:dsRNA-specific ribonuclease
MCAVCTLGEMRKRGEGMTKKEAKTEAARKMLQKLRSRGFDR